jgi:hypothetical protein
MAGWLGRNSALLAWLILVASIAAYVAAYDLWAYRTGHRMMTTQFRDWLHQEVAGPIVMGLWGGVFVALSFHFLVRATKG